MSLTDAFNTTRYGGVEQIDVTDFSDVNPQYIPGFGQPLHLHDLRCVNLKGLLICGRADVPHPAELDDDELFDVVEAHKMSEALRHTLAGQMQEFGAKIDVAMRTIGASMDTR